MASKPEQRLQADHATIEVTPPPSVNALYRNAPGRGRAKTSTYRKWQKSAGWELVSSKPNSVPGLVHVTYTLPWPKDKRRRDLANYEKALSDLLVTHGVIEDDSRIVRLELAYADVMQVVVEVRGVEVPA